MNITIRPWTMHDLDSLVNYANNFNIAKNMADIFPHPYSKQYGENFLKMATAESMRLFAIDLDGEAIGGIGIHPQGDIFRKNAELGYWLAEPFWGKGIVVKAIELIVPKAFETYDITRLFARAFGTNKASQRVLEKAGFVFEARLEKTFFKNGEFFDELIYAVRR